MRLNRKNSLIRISPASAAALLSVSAMLALSFCSRSDVIVDAGASVVEGIDSALIAAPGRAFAKVTLDSLYHHWGQGDIIDSAFSLPASRDPSLGTYMSGGMAIGIENGDTLAAHAQFRTTGGFSEYRDADSVTLDSACIYFRAADTVRAPITLFRSDTLAGSAPVDNAADKARNDPIGAVTVKSDTCSVRLPDTIAERIFNVRKSRYSTVSFENFAFSIVDYAGETLKLDTPYIVIFVSVIDIFGEKSPEQTLDIIPSGGVRYTVFENSDSENRAGRPYSSQRTRRTAVFRVNMKNAFGSLAEIFPTDSCEVMNAVAAVRPDSLTLKDLGAYAASASDKLWTYEALSDSADAAFAGVGSVLPASPYRTHDFKAAMRSVLKKYNADPRETPYIYIYLRPVTEGSVIVWDRPNGPQKIETVFTRLR